MYDVSRFGYYSWKRRGASKHEKRDIELKGEVLKLFDEYNGIYGSPKIHALLQQAGVTVGKNRIAGIMQECSLKARCARIYRNNTAHDRFYASIDNKIHKLDATAPNQIWVGDV